MCVIRGAARQSGYAMAALLVGLSVMSIIMSVALPVWNTAAKREREAELVWRADQYANAIRLYMNKNGGANNFPPSIDVLVQGRYLRKKYKDPITNDEFDVVRVGEPIAPAPRGTGPLPGGRGTVGGGAIMGVRSKSTQAPLRVVAGGATYRDWIFMPVQASTAAGQTTGGTAPRVPGRRAPAVAAGRGGPAIGAPGGGQNPGQPGGQNPGQPRRGGPGTQPGPGGPPGIGQPNRGQQPPGRGLQPFGLPPFGQPGQPGQPGRGRGQ